MPTPHWWHDARTAFLDLIFPPRCRTCRQHGQWYCTRCIAAIQRVRAPYCARCGQELRQTRRCAYCRLHPLPDAVNGLRAVALHTGTLRTAIHALKYERMTAIAEPLGSLLSDYLQHNPVPCTLIMPVPLHAERMRERGYNQSALLAEVVSRRSGVPLQRDTLVRARNTIPQVGLNESERRKNLIDAFACRQRVDGQQVLLIDDVCTTGATLSECAIALREAGAQSVWGLTLAR